jgi:hypothetical protein
MLQFNNNHIFTGYLKQFLSSFNLPTCRVYTTEFEKFYAEHGYEDPRVIESNLPIIISGPNNKLRPTVGITYLKEGIAQQYFWDTHNWQTDKNPSDNNTVKYWKSNKNLYYNGNKILGLTKNLKNPTTLYNYQTHEYLGDYLRFLRDYENINLMSMYNCFSNRLCNNIKIKLDKQIAYKKANFTTGELETKEKTVTINVNAYDNNYKIYMLPVKLFENYTIAIDCYQGVELFCGLYNEKLDTSEKNKDLIKRTYVKIPKALFNQPFIYDKLDVKYWNWTDENTLAEAEVPYSTLTTMTKYLRSELALQENELKLFIKIPATNTSSIAVLEGDYRNFNDAIYTLAPVYEQKDYSWKYVNNSTITNFETDKTYKYSKLPEINSREFKPISKLQLLAINTGISYPFADRLIEYLVANTILPNDPTPDNIKRLQKIMEDCGYSFQVNGSWEPKMQMILYDYLMNSGKFTVVTKTDSNGDPIYNKKGELVYKVKDNRAGNLKQKGQKNRSEIYDVLGYVDKDAEKLYAAWAVEPVKKNDGTVTQQIVAKETLENVDIYSSLYNN